ncbi:hypothetical protein VAITEPHAGE_26 [Vibrio phage Vaitephage]|nr:hypothetical protein BAYBAE_26 [Vibrio phage Baybae]WCD55665.1 hypothetical protein VAITEPHAGE_26 [Vibrio phage Vaitephage]
MVGIERRLLKINNGAEWSTNRSKHKMPINKRLKSEHPFQVYLRSLSPEQREKLADDCGTKYDYLRKLCGNGGRQPSPELAKTIEQFTGIHRGLLRPDIWEAPKDSQAA